MLKIKSAKLFNNMGFIAVFAFMSIAVNAQDNNKTASPSGQLPYSSTHSIDSSKQVLSPESQESPATQDLAFNTAALQLSNELIQKTGLATDKSEKISKILVNYRNDIAKARDYYHENQKEINENEIKDNDLEDNENITGSQSKVDMTGILGDNVEQYYAGSAPSMMKDYKEADRKSDGKIKDIFDNDVQKSRYSKIKTQWWNDVKGKVFSTLNTPAQSQTK